MALAALALVPAAASGKALTDAELVAVEARLAPVQPYAAKLAIEEGGTIVIERAVEVPASRVRRPASDYEAIVTGVVAPKGIVVHPRMDAFTLTDAGSKKTVTFRYVVHVDPGTRSGGRVRLTLSLVERTGFANTIHKAQLNHWFDVKTPSPSPRDLSADFWGYRHFQKKMKRAARTLKRARLSRISTQDNARLPALDRQSPKVAALALAFSGYRMRVWSAHRHLVTALQSPNPQIASLARTYLGAVNKPDDQLGDLPEIPILAGSSAPTAAKVEQLEPVARTPAPPTSKPSAGGTLAPVKTYESGSDREGEGSLPRSSRPREVEPPPGPVAAVTPAQQAPAGDPSAGGSETVVMSDDLLAGRRTRQLTYIPGYFRSLTLDDPNIGYGGSVRLAWAGVQLNESAITSAIFYNAQVAITRFVGVEVTVPTEYVNLDLDRARSVYAMGNPLLALKWRLFLPEIEGRAPVLTLRGRWAIPIPPQHQVPPTPFIAEHFSREAHFADTYAFFLEKTALGLGTNAAWQYDMFEFGLQLYLDYFTPVEGAQENASFLAFSYGASFGVLPWGDLLGFFAEARAVSLFAGPRRTEFFAYLGARARLFDYFEPALWVAHPLGSVANVSGFQLGVELRFSYDLEAILEDSTTVERDDTIFE